MTGGRGNPPPPSGATPIITMKTTKQNQLFGAIGYIHEIFHALPVWVMGGTAIICSDRVDFEGDLYDWQVAVILLGPAIVGIIGLGVTIGFILGKPLNFARAGWVIFWLGWLAACRDDFNQVFHFYKTHKWNGD